MALALRLADQATAVARPNPGVGCVLLRDGVVLAFGATEQVGGRHAEVVALDAAGASARGATAVVTLEPCNHTGRTGPCSRALVEAGVARVVVATTDPGAAAGGGAATLRGAGVEVVEGVFGDWAREVQRRFLVAAGGQRPHVTLKVARTADGALALRGRRWVTGVEARRRVHELRALADGVLVGVGTVLADDPGLDVRDAEAPAGQPRPIILDSRLRTPPSSRVVQRGAIVVGVKGALDEARRALELAGAEVLLVAGVDGRVDAEAALRALLGVGIGSVFAEPGPALQRDLWDRRLVDDLIVHASPDVADAPDLPTVPDAIARPLELDVRQVRLLGDDLEVHARRRV